MRSIAAKCCTSSLPISCLLAGNAQLGKPASSLVYVLLHGTTGWSTFMFFDVLLQLGFVLKRRGLSPNRFFTCCTASRRAIHDLAEPHLAQSHQVDSDGELEFRRSSRGGGTWLHLFDASQLVRVVFVQDVFRQMCLACDQ
ncbi:uncharacterized protein LOC128093117 [Culex pipiens pallens]|uniref:uncharacterized protein LOC128093117 n=1 Tax=Culex pipiens pallens TaxID=42434 RepID=UPI0022AA8317|nr:uncharacterized protein LOC128093117 [Culex pipiens pallens]